MTEEKPVEMNNRIWYNDPNWLVSDAIMYNIVKWYKPWTWFKSRTGVSISYGKNIITGKITIYENS